MARQFDVCLGSWVTFENTVTFGMDPPLPIPHQGAKVALFLGRRLVVILRDDRSDIPWPNCWDLPGGGREGAETPFQTVVREVFEEINLRLPPHSVVWQRAFVSPRSNDQWHGFFVAQLPETNVSKIQLGDEGQRWELMDVSEFRVHPQRVRVFDERLDLWVAATGGVDSLPE